MTNGLIGRWVIYQDKKTIADVYGLVLATEPGRVYLCDENGNVLQRHPNEIRVLLEESERNALKRARDDNRRAKDISKFAAP